MKGRVVECMLRRARSGRYFINARILCEDGQIRFSPIILIGSGFLGHPDTIKKFQRLGKRGREVIGGLVLEENGILPINPFDVEFYIKPFEHNNTTREMIVNLRILDKELTMPNYKRVAQELAEKFDYKLKQKGSMIYLQKGDCTVLGVRGYHKACNYIFDKHIKKEVIK